LEWLEVRFFVGRNKVTFFCTLCYLFIYINIFTVRKYSTSLLSDAVVVVRPLLLY